MRLAFPPGGGLEPGEDAVAAAHRELEEETGLRTVSPGRELWQRRHVFTWRGREYDQRERWFLAEVAHFEPETAGLNDDELVPPHLAARLRRLLAARARGGQLGKGSDPEPNSARGLTPNLIRLGV